MKEMGEGVADSYEGQKGVTGDSFVNWPSRILSQPQ